jgi:hypothetical protein
MHLSTITSLDHNHHGNTMEIYIYTYPMVETRKQSFAPGPHEASLSAKIKGVHEQINSDPDIQSKQRRSLSERLKLVCIQIEEAGMQRVNNLVLEEHQGQPHLYSCLVSSPHATIIAIAKMIIANIIIRFIFCWL